MSSSCDSIWQGISLALSALADPRVLDAVSARGRSRRIQIPKPIVTALRTFITAQFDQLKTEQDHIARRLAYLDGRIEAGGIEHELVKAHLDDWLALAGDCHQLYMGIDDSLRRIGNQALFDKLYLSEEGTIDAMVGPEGLEPPTPWV